MIHYCLVDLNNRGEVFRIGIDAQLSKDTVIAYFKKFSKDVDYAGYTDEKGKRARGKRQCEIGTIVSCRFVKRKSRSK